MLSLDEARDWLRVDGTDNDPIIEALLVSTGDYIRAAVGDVDLEEESGFRIVDTIQRMLLTLWYNAEQSEAERLQRTIDGLIKSYAALLKKGL